MTPLLLSRMGITFLIFTFGLVLYRYYWYSVSSELSFPASGKKNQPTILYFSSPDCVTCHTIQSPALEMLGATIRDKINIIEVDTTQQPELAKKWKILSVPTLIILDAKGELAFIKHGAQSAPALLTDIQPLTVS